MLLPLSVLSASVPPLPRVSWTFSSCSAPPPPSLPSPVRCAPEKASPVGSTAPRTHLTALEAGLELGISRVLRKTQHPAVGALLSAQGLGRAERNRTPCFPRLTLSKGLFSPAQNEHPETAQAPGPQAQLPQPFTAITQQQHRHVATSPACPPKKGPGQALKPKPDPNAPPTESRSSLSTWAR